jgi:hypothetical protein
VTVVREIDLKILTRDGEVRNLSGHDRGQEARKKFDLDQIDQGSEHVRVIVPEDLYTLTSSFFQGMFAQSVKLAGDRDKFLSRFKFDADPVVLRQIDNGISASLMHRRPLMG